MNTVKNYLKITAIITLFSCTSSTEKIPFLELSIPQSKNTAITHFQKLLDSDSIEIKSTQVNSYQSDIYYSPNFSRNTNWVLIPQFHNDVLYQLTLFYEDSLVFENAISISHHLTKAFGTPTEIDSIGHNKVAKSWSSEKIGVALLLEKKHLMVRIFQHEIQNSINRTESIFNQFGDSCDDCDDLDTTSFAMKLMYAAHNTGHTQ